jgi:hypothetical protein
MGQLTLPYDSDWARISSQIDTQAKALVVSRLGTPTVSTIRPPFDKIFKKGLFVSNILSQEQFDIYKPSLVSTNTMKDYKTDGHLLVQVRPVAMLPHTASGFSWGALIAVPSDEKKVAPKLSSREAGKQQLYKSLKFDQVTRGAKFYEEQEVDDQTAVKTLAERCGVQAELLNARWIKCKVPGCKNPVVQLNRAHSISSFAPAPQVSKFDVPPCLMFKDVASCTVLLDSLCVGGWCRACSQEIQVN